MLARRKTTGRLAGLSDGVATAGFESVTSGMARPCSVVPKLVTRTSGDLALIALRKLSRSAARLVSS